MCDHDAALYCLRTLNNEEIGKRCLVIDFALEDQRKLYKRDQKLESFNKKKKEAERKDLKAKPKDKLKRKEKEKNKEKDKGQKKERKLSDIQDPSELKKLLKSTKSRGKKQRIKKKLIAMGEIQAPVKKEEVKKEAVQDVEMHEESHTEEKIKVGGKRREHDDNREMEKAIMKDRKQKKQKKRDQIRSKTDKFDVSCT